MIKSVNWTAVRAKLQKKYKKIDFDCLINFQKFLKVLKIKVFFEYNNFMYYYQLFALVSKNLLLK